MNPSQFTTASLSDNILKYSILYMLIYEQIFIIMSSQIKIKLKRIFST